VGCANNVHGGRGDSASIPTLVVARLQRVLPPEVEMRCSLALSLLLVACASRHNGSDDTSGDGPGTGDDAALPDVGGGSIDDLRFAVVGDTRPAAPDDTKNYPTAIITKIWQDIEAETPHPQFAVSTGDYMFASTNKSEQDPQLAKYMAAR